MKSPAQLGAPNGQGRSWGERMDALGPILALLLLIVLGWWLDAAVNDPDSRRFLSVPNFLNILRQNAAVGVIALGMTFVIIQGGIDLSVGSAVALIGLCALGTLNAIGPGSPVWAIVWACVTALGVGLLIGLVQGLLITKGRIAPFIATLGGMAAFRSLAIARADGGEVRSTVDSYGVISGGAITIPLPDSAGKLLGVASIGLTNPVIVFFALAAASSVVLSRTTFGRKVYAVGDNETAAMYAGVNVDRVRIGVYALMGLFCGIAATLVSSRMNSVSSTGSGVMYELDAIAAVVVGGTAMRGGSGSIWRTLVGVLILGVVNNTLTMIGTPDALSRLSEFLLLRWIRWFHLQDVNISYLQGFVKGLIIVCAVLVQRGRKA